MKENNNNNMKTAIATRQPVQINGLVENWHTVCSRVLKNTPMKFGHLSDKVLTDQNETCWPCLTHNPRLDL